MKKILIAVLLVVSVSFLVYLGTDAAYAASFREVQLKSGEKVKVSFGSSGSAVVRNGKVLPADKFVDGKCQKGLDSIIFALIENIFGEADSIGKCVLDPDTMIYPDLNDGTAMRCGRVYMFFSEDLIDASIYVLAGPSVWDIPPNVDDHIYEYNYFSVYGVPKKEIIDDLKGRADTFRLYWRYLGDDPFVTFNPHKNGLEEHFTYMGVSQDYNGYLGGKPFYILKRGTYTILFVARTQEEDSYHWVDFNLSYVGDPPPSVSVKRTSDAKDGVIEQVPGTNAYKTKAHRLELIDALGRILKSVEGPEKPLTIEEAGAYYLRAREKNGRVAGSKGVVKTR